MNSARIATALRLLADAIEDEAPEITNAPEKGEKRKRVRAPYRPATPATEADNAKADQALRHAGLLKTIGPRTE